MAPRQTYGAITINNEDSEFISLTGTSQDSPVAFPSAATKKRSWTMGGMALLLVGLVVTLVHTTSTGSSSSSNAAQVGGDGTTSRSPTFEKVDASTILSELSPADLGFSSVERAEDASPSEIWGHQTGPLPTNSWYLVRIILPYRWTFVALWYCMVFAKIPNVCYDICICQLIHCLVY